MRLDRFMQNAGVCSRKEAKKIICSGKITVNGEICLNFQQKIDENKDVIHMSGKLVEYEKFIYIMMNKPSGYVSATEDKREKTVIDLLPEGLKNRELFPVGRLDKDTTGLLILTNDGDFSHRALSPKKKVFKKYFVGIEEALEKVDIDAFSSGIDIGDYKCLPAVLEIIDKCPPAKAYVSICEGKFHQVKRMFKSLGKNVISLERVAFGEVLLDRNLLPGEFRRLTEIELEMLNKR